MVRCPKCGHQNPDGSRFCNACGAPLQRTRIRCPKCGTFNAVGNLFCDKCHVRLIPAEKIIPPEAKSPPEETAAQRLKGISLPTRDQNAGGETKDTDLPDWLRELSNEPANQDEAAPEAEEVPDWLAEVDTGPTEKPEPEPQASEALPDWLAAADVGGETAQASEEEQSTGGEAGLPDWLSGLIDENLSATQGPESAASETPEPAEEGDSEAWLSGLIEERPSEPAAQADAEELPDWLAGLMGEEDTLTPTEPTPEEEVAPDWLVEAADEAPETEAAEVAPAPEELPDWLQGPSTPAAPQETGPSEATPYLSDTAADYPDWLVETADQAQPIHEAAPAELPAWLAQSSDEVQPEVSGGAQATLPNWLLRHSDDAQPAAGMDEEISVAPEAPPAESDWLSGLLPEETPEAAPSDVGKEAAATADEGSDWLAGLVPEEEEPAVEEVAPEQEEMPDWLAGLVETTDEGDTGTPIFAEEAASASPEPEADQSGLTDWLSNLPGGGETSEAPAAPQEAEGAPEAPDWFSTLASSTEPKPTTEEQESAPQVPASSTGLTGWLSNLEEETEPAAEAAAEPKGEPPEAELPDWLREEAPPTEAEEPAGDVFTQSVEDQSELPDWLQNLDEEEAMVETGAEPAEAVTEEAPDWLAGLETEEPDISAPPSIFADAEERAETPPEEELEAAEMPDWLQETPEGAPPTAEAAEETQTEEVLPDTGPEPEIPDWISELESAPGAPPERTAAAFGDDNLARANVPRWLKNLQPPGTGPLAPPIDIEIPSEESGLAQAEVPEWVKALRPRVGPDGEIERPAFEGPVEQEGPLSGLPGVLPAALLVDIPIDFQPAPRPELPEAVVEQAELWQALLERPRSVERPVTQSRPRAGSSKVVVRLIVTILLLATALLTILGIPQDLLQVEHLAQAPMHSGISNLQGAINDLSAGDVVVMALEYGAAEAEEMQPMAVALTEHLEEQQVEVLAVSTLADGAGLVNALATNAQISLTLPTGQSTALLGGAINGISTFLATPQAQAADFLLIISSRPSHLRWWVEQNIAVGELPMGVGMSASSGPFTTPYLENKGVAGWLIGFTDVVAYKEARGIRDTVQSLRLDALMVTHWIAISLLIFGLFYGLAAKKRP